VIGVMCGGGFCRPAGPPDPDDCRDPGTRAPVESLELGRGAEGTFIPILDGEKVQMTWGPQGGIMLAFRLRVVGDAPPDCLPQSTSVTYQRDGLPILEAFDLPLATYDYGARTRTTRQAFVIFDQPPSEPEAQATVRVEAGGQTIERKLILQR
jgi:hypothetical protein